jgi:hypothetical protein
MRHHRFGFEVACPGCGAAGTILVLEDAGPPFTDQPRRRYCSRDEKFQVIVAARAVIRCLACGKQFSSRY